MFEEKKIKVFPFSCWVSLRFQTSSEWTDRHLLFRRGCCQWRYGFVSSFNGTHFQNVPLFLERQVVHRSLIICLPYLCAYPVLCYFYESTTIQHGSDFGIWIWVEASTGTHCVGTKYYYNVWYFTTLLFSFLCLNLILIFFLPFLQDTLAFTRRASALQISVRYRVL